MEDRVPASRARDPASTRDADGCGKIPRVKLARVFGAERVARVVVGASGVVGPKLRISTVDRRPRRGARSFGLNATTTRRRCGCDEWTRERRVKLCSRSSRRVGVRATSASLCGDGFGFVGRKMRICRVSNVRARFRVCLGGSNTLAFLEVSKS